MEIKMKFLALGAVFAKLKDSLVAELPEHLDDEKNYGVLASDIACSTGFHPAVIKKELDKMQAVKNPLVSPELLNEGRRQENYNELVKAVRQRVLIAYPDKPGPHPH
jgi:hypothetical protein